MENQSIRETQLDYIRRVQNRTGWSLTKLARKAGVDASTLTRFVNKKDHKSNLSATTLSKIEGLTGIKAPVPTEVVPLPLPLRYLAVEGSARAGAWLEVSVADRHETEQIPVGPSPRYAGKPQYALKIEGDSLNRHPKAQDGDYAVCVQWASLGYEEPPEGSYVHVERYRGGMTEVTIKRVHYIDDTAQLRPYSDNPNHSKCLELGHSDEDTVVEIKGLVIGWYSHQN